MPRGTGFSGRLMPAGHLLFRATKKGDKKPAGNAIPRFRLPSGHWKKEFLNLRLITMFSLSQAGATPGVGLQRRGACCGPAGSGRQLYKLTVRLNRFTHSALRPPPEAA